MYTALFFLRRLLPVVQAPEILPLGRAIKTGGAIRQQPVVLCRQTVKTKC